MGGGARAVRAVVVLAGSVGGWAALVLPSARYAPGMYPAGLPSPELSLALRVVCAIALAAAFAVGWVTLKRRRDDVLAFATLPGLVVAGIAVQYLVRTLPGLAGLSPAAGLGPALGTWLLLGAGLLVTLTGLVASHAAKKR